MNLREAPLIKQQDVTREPFFLAAALVHSGWGLDQFPAEYLSIMAHYGFDAALLFVGDPFGPSAPPGSHTEGLPGFQ